MQNKNDNSQKIVLGLMIGAIVGAGTLYYIKAYRHRQTPIVHKIGRTLSEVGQMLENSKDESFSNIAHEIQDFFPKGKEMMSSVLNWLSSAMSLWNKIKQRGGL